MKLVSTQDFPLVPYHKGVKVDFEKQTIDYFIHSKLCNEAMEKVNWESIVEVGALIRKFDDMNQCPGINHRGHGLVAQTLTTGELVGATLHSNK